MKLPERATQPTMYFIGVTTTRSSIMKLFPVWADALGIGNAILKGIDIEINADPQVYRDVVEFIKNDELSLGALVTTHKINIYNAAKDFFDYLDPYATMLGELSSISKKDGRLEGYAKDPISSGLAIETFVPENYWKDFGGELFLMGAGGGSVAISSYLLNPNKEENIPSRIIITDLDETRLHSIEGIIKQINPNANVEYHLTPNVEQTDALLNQLKPHSLIVNATGLGKDRPGSPISDNAVFPNDSIVWELNYRGELDFMHQALRQKEERNLIVEDGWVYFIHGWTQVIAEVFHIDITEEVFKHIKQLSDEMR